MAIVRLDLAYDGTDFYGWAKQPGRRTVEGVLAEFLEQITTQPVRLSVGGRTDAGVHARGQVVSFESESEPDEVRRGVNSLLAPEIVALSARLAPQGFDARYSASARAYRYRMYTGRVPDPFEARYAWCVSRHLDLARMRAGSRSLVGTHDFSSFCRSRGPSGRGSAVRSIRRLTVARKGDRIEIGFVADGFLHHMVRIIVGTLAEVGIGRSEPDDLEAILRERDRSRSAKAAPALGLTLESVIYGARSGRRAPGGRSTPR